MIPSRLLPLKFFSRYEILFSITSPASLPLNTTINEMFLAVYLIRNPTLEVITALSVLCYSFPIYVTPEDIPNIVTDDIPIGVSGSSKELDLFNTADLTSDS